MDIAANSDDVCSSSFLPSGPAKVITHPPRQCVVPQLCQDPISNAPSVETAATTLGWIFLMVGILIPASPSFPATGCASSNPEQREQREQPEQREQREQ